MNIFPKRVLIRRMTRVKGTIYEISENFGAFVAVDDLYSGLIPKREFFGQAKIGDVVETRVTRVKEDGKLDLSSPREDLSSD